MQCGAVRRDALAQHLHERRRANEAPQLGVTVVQQRVVDLQIHRGRQAAQQHLLDARSQGAARAVHDVIDGSADACRDRGVRRVRGDGRSRPPCIPARIQQALQELLLALLALVQPGQHVTHVTQRVVRHELDRATSAVGPPPGQRVEKGPLDGRAPRLAQLVDAVLEQCGPLTQARQRPVQQRRRCIRHIAAQLATLLQRRAVDALIGDLEQRAHALHRVQPDALVAAMQQHLALGVYLTRSRQRREDARIQRCAVRDRSVDGVAAGGARRIRRAAQRGDLLGRQLKPRHVRVDGGHATGQCIALGRGVAQRCRGCVQAAPRRVQLPGHGAAGALDGVDLRLRRLQCVRGAGHGGQQRAVEGNVAPLQLAAQLAPHAGRIAALRIAAVAGRQRRCSSSGGGGAGAAFHRPLRVRIGVGAGVVAGIGVGAQRPQRLDQLLLGAMPMSSGDAGGATQHRTLSCSRRVDSTFATRRANGVTAGAAAMAAVVAAAAVVVVVTVVALPVDVVAIAAAGDDEDVDANVAAPDNVADAP